MVCAIVYNPYKQQAQVQQVRFRLFFKGKGRSRAFKSKSAAQTSFATHFSSSISKTEEIVKSLGANVGNIVKPLRAKLKPMPKLNATANGMPKFNKHQIPHIFRDVRGHFKADTPFNRKIIKSTVVEGKNWGIDKYGKTWHTRILSDGRQVWVHTRNNEIVNAGINNKPRIKWTESGLK